MRLGIRVVRGPDWKWQDQDGGEGHIGTVIDLPPTTPGTCLVQWDSMSLMNYRAGLNSQFDLRIFDSAPTGIKHDCSCSGCDDKVICGILWTCMDCQMQTPSVLIYLCTCCYMNDKHSTQHAFRRLCDPASLLHTSGVAVPPRCCSHKIDSYGVFPGAVVKRGRDWSWDNQDGGDGSLGVVKQLQGWPDESSRSVVSVEWKNGINNVYRMGHRGQTDLITVMPARGWSFYVDHLPNFGEEFFDGRLPIFTTGELVKIDNNMDRVKKLADGHGQWHGNMRDYIGAIGTVHRFTEKDDVRVIFPDKIKWTYNPRAVTKVFQIGARVILTEDVETISEYHGDCVNSLLPHRGMHGVIVEITTGLCRVHLGSQTYLIHANCLYAEESITSRQHNTLNSIKDQSQQPSLLPSANLDQPALFDVDSARNFLASLSITNPVNAASQNTTTHQFALPLIQQKTPSGHEIQLFAEALDRCNMALVKDLLEKYPTLVNSQHENLHALIRATNTGNYDILRLFTDYKVSVDGIRDSENDTPIFIAIKKGFASLIPIFVDPLWSNVAQAPNSERQTPLHVAVKLGSIEIIRSLLSISSIHFNAKDKDGNTALHLAIAMSREDIVRTMLNFTTKVNPSVFNQNGHNALHLACIKGHGKIIQAILSSRSDLVNTPNQNGFPPLLLAVYHNHPESVLILFQQPFVCLNARVTVNRKYSSLTSLHLAALMTHWKIVVILVEKCPSVLSLKDDINSNTPLHLAAEALMKKECNLTAEQLYNLQQISYDDFSMEALLARCPGYPELAVFCYLLAKGADPLFKNNLKLDALELIASNNKFRHLLPIAKFFKSFFDQTPTIGSSIQSTISGPSSRLDDNPNVVQQNAVESSNTACDFCDAVANVRFEPCKHVIFCFRCTLRLPSLNKCRVCQNPIKEIIGPNGQILSRPFNAASTSDMSCTICVTREKNVAPRCGHMFCRQCANKMCECAICREPMVDVRPIYF